MSAAQRATRRRQSRTAGTTRLRVGNHLVPSVACENVLLAVPLAPLCRADCPGLCQQCGADLQVDRCSCTRAERDDRLAALDSLNFESRVDEA